MTNTELVADIKLKAQISSDSGSYDDAAILNVATKELQSVIVPKILSVRERYFATSKDFTLSTVRGYRIPPEAVGNKLLQVEYVDTASGSKRDLNQVTPENAPKIEGFFIRNNTLYLTDYAPTSGTLRLHFSMRPGFLTTTFWTVGAVSVGAGIDTLTGSPAIGDIVSIQKKSSPYEFVIYDQVLNSVGGSQFVLPLGVYDGIEVGDIVTFIPTASTTKNLDPRKSYFAQIPDEMHDWLSLRTTIRILGSLGHSELQDKHKQDLKDVEKDILALISPRVDGSPKIIPCGELLGWST